MKHAISGAILLLSAAACGGEGQDGDDGPAYGVAGNYTLVYERTSRSDTCETRDMDFLSGILTVSHDAGSVTLDFGSGHVVSGTINSDSFYDVSGTFVDGSDSIQLSSKGSFTETGMFSDPDQDQTHETVGDYDFDSDPEPDCRIRGKISGTKSS